MDKLALFGGSRSVSKGLTPYNHIGTEELTAASQVIESGILSDYLGTWGPKFFGGSKVREFERNCQNYFDVKHAISVNSWSSGLSIAVGSIGIEPGDEIIVTPWTMCATATAILHWNAIPVFADIQKDTFNICPKSVKKNITANTKAIMAVDIFGHSCDVDALMEIAEEYKIKLITDSAQAPGSFYHGKHTGTQSHLGGFSLNYHKHIHTGEGGILVTNDDEIADKMRLIRNHAEAVVEGMGIEDITNMVGNNYRLGEIESAIGIEQLKKLDNLIALRQEIAAKLTTRLSGLTGLRMPIVRPNCTHSYYMFPMVLDDAFPIGRERLIEALEAEGVEGLTNGYVNVHLLPMYQKKIAYGSRGFPWSSDICKREVNYKKGICPVAEHLHQSTYLGLSICLYDLSDNQINDIGDAFTKVWANLEIL